MGDIVSVNTEFGKTVWYMMRRTDVNQMFRVKRLALLLESSFLIRQFTVDKHRHSSQCPSAQPKVKITESLLFQFEVTVITS